MDWQSQLITLYLFGIEAGQNLIGETIRPRRCRKRPPGHRRFTSDG